MELSDVIRRAWQDAEFKARLLNAPRETLGRRSTWYCLPI